MTDSCCSMTEISATLQSNYHSIKNKKLGLLTVNLILKTKEISFFNNVLLYV